jgi:hypothetical protein
LHHQTEWAKPQPPTPKDLEFSKYRKEEIACERAMVMKQEKKDFFKARANIRERKVEKRVKGHKLVKVVKDKGDTMLEEET